MQWNVLILCVLQDSSVFHHGAPWWEDRGRGWAAAGLDWGGQLSVDESSFAGMLIFQTGLSFPAAVVWFWLPGSVLVPLSIMIMILDQVSVAKGSSAGIFIQFSFTLVAIERATVTWSKLAGLNPCDASFPLYNKELLRELTRLKMSHLWQI